MRFNDETGRDEYVPVGVTMSLNVDALPREATPRLLSLLELASFVEISFHLNRLLLHRRKASLGEASLPMFVQDLAGDLRREGVTSLGIALLVDHLRTKARDQWFPVWAEIEEARGKIEGHLRKIRQELLAKSAENQPPLSLA